MLYAILFFPAFLWHPLLLLVQIACITFHGGLLQGSTLFNHSSNSLRTSRLFPRVQIRVAKILLLWLVCSLLPLPMVTWHQIILSVAPLLHLHLHLLLSDSCKVQWTLDKIIRWAALMVVPTMAVAMQQFRRWTRQAHCSQIHLPLSIRQYPHHPITVWCLLLKIQTN